MTALTAALATINTDVENWQPAAMARGLLIGYDARWQMANQSIRVVEIEKVYESPLVNIETNRNSRTFRVAGKIDKLAEDSGLCLYDHKTTSSDIEDPDSTYWRQLVIEGQASHYELLLLANGIKVDRVVWDVVRKPGIRPKKIAKVDQAQIVSLGKYCGYDVSEETQERVKFVGEENEELYELRVAAETIANPARYFQRRSVPRTRVELAEYQTELWDIATEIRLARASNRWYRNSGACMAYGTPCVYLGICSGHDTPDSDRWTRREDVHQELESTVGDTKAVLTNSRLRCFQTCHRKHFYQYEMGLTRIDEEEREVLWFGRLWGQALDVWWKLQQGERDGNGNERPVDAVGGSARCDAQELPF